MSEPGAEPGRGRSAATRRCRWCGRPFDVLPGRGRPKEFCRQSCRQRDYEARRRSTELGLGDDHLVVARADVDELYDRLYALEAAIEDVERDLTESPTADEVRESLDWLLAAARPLIGVRLGDSGP